jgi:hypothetical protein
MLLVALISFMKPLQLQLKEASKMTLSHFLQSAGHHQCITASSAAASRVAPSSKSIQYTLNKHQQ